jgi:hypothetical protein
MEMYCNQIKYRYITSCYVCLYIHNTIINDNFVYIPILPQMSSWEVNNNVMYTNHIHITTHCGLFQSLSLNNYRGFLPTTFINTLMVCHSIWSTHWKWCVSFNLINTLMVLCVIQFDQHTDGGVCHSISSTHWWWCMSFNFINTLMVVCVIQFHQHTDGGVCHSISSTHWWWSVSFNFINTLMVECVIQFHQHTDGGVYHFQFHQYTDGGVCHSISNW